MPRSIESLVRFTPIPPTLGGRALEHSSSCRSTFDQVAHLHLAMSDGSLSASRRDCRAIAMCRPAWPLQYRAGGTKHEEAIGDRYELSLDASSPSTALGPRLRCYLRRRSDGRRPSG